MDARDLATRTLRIVLGAALGAGLIASGALVGFVGLWTYAGFKTPGDPGLGLVVFAGAVALVAAGGMVLGWALGAHSQRIIRRVGGVFAVVAVAVTVWFVGAN